LPSDVPQGRNDNVGTNFGGTTLLKFERAITFKNQRDLGQLSILTANISEMEQDVKKCNSG